MLLVVTKHSERKNHCGGDLLITTPYLHCIASVHLMELLEANIFSIMSNALAVFTGYFLNLGTVMKRHLTLD